MEDQVISTIKIDLTNKCNAKCWFCPYHGKNGSVTTLLRVRREEVSILELADFEKMIAELSATQQFSQFKFSGRGEATIHPHFEKIVKLISENGMATRLITNGIRLGSVAKVLNQCKVSTLVSLHGPTEIHDKIVGVQGAYKKISKAIIAIKEDGGSINIATVITPEILPYLSSFVETWNEHGVVIRLQHDYHAWHQQFFPVGKLRGILKSTRVARTLPDLPEALLENYYAHDKHMVINPRECNHIKEEVDVRSDGTVYICRSKAFGNIRNTNIAEIIKGTRRQKFLQEIKDETSNTNGLDSNFCDRCCYQLPPF